MAAETRRADFEALLCCPVCRGTLTRTDDPPAYVCGACAHAYPVHFGIPDFRVWADPYIPMDDDWAKGERVVRESPGGFRGMLETYWRMTPGTPASMAGRFVRYALVATARGRTRLARLAELRGRPLQSDEAVLDVGCGVGGLVVAAAESAGLVVGVDIAARWLVIAQAHLREAEAQNAYLVCACAERLPFRDGAFDVAVAADVLEHSREPRALLGEVARCLGSTGVFFLSTQNRWSLAGEPHVRLPGVGFLPRRWQEPYVRLVRGVPYQLIRLVSRPELVRLLRESGLAATHWLLPRFSTAEAEGLTVADKCLIALYTVLARLPGFRLVLAYLGPALEAVARPAAAPPGNRQAA